jgi:cobalt-zinc-cadmium efflux system membrane fusion protein
MKYLIVIVAALASLPACGRKGDATAGDVVTAAMTEPGTVVIAADAQMLKRIKRETVSTKELPTDEVVAAGRIEANPNRVSKVVLPVAGRVTSVLVKTGDAVKKDQPLLTIQSSDADAAMSTFLSSQAAVTQARAALIKTQADFDRTSDLFEHNAVAKKDVLANESALAQAKAGLEQAQASQVQAGRRLAVLGLKPGDFTQEVVLRSPLAGKILELSVVPGEFRNDTSVGVMTIADLSTVWVTSQVPESYIRFVQKGERVEISLVAYPGEAFEGRVSRIADTLDPQTRTVKVQAELDNHNGRFRPEMYGSIHHVESTAKITVIPFAAVLQDGSRTAVFVEQAPGRFVERDVSVGKRAGALVRVISGLHPGEIVDADGVMLLKGLVKRTDAP